MRALLISVILGSLALGCAAPVPVAPPAPIAAPEAPTAPAKAPPAPAAEPPAAVAPTTAPLSREHAVWASPSATATLAFCGHLVATDVTELACDDAGVRDLEPLASLHDLTRLNLWGTRAADLRPLRGLQKLESLVLGYEKLVDLTPLAGLRQLRSLTLLHCGATSLDALIALPELRTLILDGNTVSPAALARLRAARPKLAIELNRDR